MPLTPKKPTATGLKLMQTASPLTVNSFSEKPKCLKNLKEILKVFSKALNSSCVRLIKALSMAYTVLFREL